MSFIDLGFVGGETLTRAEKLLAGIQGGAERAARSAMPRAVSHLRSRSVKRIREKYDISAQAIRTEQNVKVRYTYGNGVRASVSFNGHKIPLHRYGKASPKAPTRDMSKQRVPVRIGGETRLAYPGVAAAGHQFKSTTATRFSQAFVARMQSGHIGIFERDDSSKLRQYMGSSVAQMLGNEDVQRQLGEDAMQKFEERLEHEITRILNGWGGG